MTLKNPPNLAQVLIIGGSYTQGAANGGTPSILTLTGGAHTALAASEVIDIDLALNRTVELTGSGGTLALQRTVVIRGATYAFTSGHTITSATTLQITAAPAAGTNATITNALALSIASFGGSGSTTIAAFSTIMPGIANGVGNVITMYGIGMAAAGNVTLGNQTANLTNLLLVNLPSLTFVSTTNTRTVTSNIATLYIAGAPTAGTNVTFSASAYSVFIDAGNSRFDGRVMEGKGADVASGATITLGSDGNYFDITGTTAIDFITTTDWTAGSLASLQFDGSVTVNHNTASPPANTAAILLASAGNFSATANDVLTLRYDGVTWREAARTVI